MQDSQYSDAQGWRASGVSITTNDCISYPDLTSVRPLCKLIATGACP